MQVIKLPKATEKMTSGLSRTASWSDPAPTDTDGAPKKPGWAPAKRILGCPVR